MPRQTIRVMGKIATKPAGNSTLAVAQRPFPKLWLDQHASLVSHTALPAFALRAGG